MAVLRDYVRVTEMIHPNRPKFSSELGRDTQNLHQCEIGPAGTAMCACWASYSLHPSGTGPAANGLITSSNSERFESITSFCWTCRGRRRARVYHVAILRN